MFKTQVEPRAQRLVSYVVCNKMHIRMNTYINVNIQVKRIYTNLRQNKSSYDIVCKDLRLMIGHRDVSMLLASFRPVLMTLSLLSNWNKVSQSTMFQAVI